MKKVIFFDLGNTLVRYYEMVQFPGILQQAINQVDHFLREYGCVMAPTEAFWQHIADENHEAADFRVRPLADRLIRIFNLDGDLLGPEHTDKMCRAFMAPIFGLAVCYDDALPTLTSLRERGYKLGLVSNSPWGSPANLWREECDRLGLASALDVLVFCADVGWRKPAHPIFRHAMEKLGVSAADCVFVGDDPRWDIAGPTTIGMDAILIDRRGIPTQNGIDTINSLTELVGRF